MLSVIIIICTILGGLAAIWYFWDKIMCFFGLQKLEIYFDPNETYQRCIDVSVKKLGIFMHVMVKNEGKSDAKNCKGDLIKVERKNEDGSFSKVRGLSIPVLLKWSHEKNWEPKDIYAKTPIKLDVCYVYQNEKILHFFTEKFPRGLQTDFEPGTYLIRIRVSADNTKAAYGEFIIYWDGDWQDIKMEQYVQKTK